jgi:hypothetical protein
MNISSFFEGFDSGKDREANSTRCKGLRVGVPQDFSAVQHENLCENQAFSEPPAVEGRDRGILSRKRECANDPPAFELTRFHLSGSLPLQLLQLRESILNQFDQLEYSNPEGKAVA